MAAVLVKLQGMRKGACVDTTLALAILVPNAHKTTNFYKPKQCCFFFKCSDLTINILLVNATWSEEISLRDT